LGGVLGAALIGALAGLATALGGRVVAGLVRRLEDAFLAIPRVLLVMALAAVVQPTAAGLAVLLAATGWPALGRLVRGDLRGLAASEISAAARAAGATRWRLAWRHLLPHAAVTLLVAAGLRVGPFVLLEASLSFLGFGVPPPHPSWGNILAEGRDVLFEAWWVTALPGALLAATVLLANAAADRFRQAIG
ncbi:MAG: ABC transporter permease, partial [Acidobacteria bacterium]|nr:ABC transporter permease [Acidobacteriota bacterium]